MSKILGIEGLRAIYFGLVYPHINYCIHIWGGAAEKHTKRILVLQKRALRYMCGLKKRESCRSLFTDLNIMTFYSQYIFRTICFVKENQPELGIVNNSDVHQHNTRARHNMHIWSFDLSLTRRSARVSGCYLYNDLPTDIKNVTEYKLFKKKLKDYCLSNPFYSLSEYSNKK
jgi:hypothetical protein